MQRRQDGVGDRADAHLERRAVVDQFGAVAGDGMLRLAERGRVMFGERRVGFDGKVDIADMDQTVAVGAGHLRVDLGDDGLGRLHGGACRIHGDAQRAIAVAVGRRNLDQRRVQRQDAPAEQPRHFAQKHGDIVGIALVDRGPHIWPDEKHVGVKAARQRPRAA